MGRNRRQEQKEERDLRAKAAEIAKTDPKRAAKIEKKADDLTDLRIHYEKLTGDDGSN